MNAYPRFRGLLPAPFMLMFVALVAIPPSVRAQESTSDAEESPARPQIEQIIQQSHADVSVAFRSLDGAQHLFIKADRPFPAAPAAIQIPIMIELFAQAQAGQLRLTDDLMVHNGFRSLVDGSPFQLDPKLDPDHDLYKLIGKPISVRDLCEHMVARNSSLAADLLIEKLGSDDIRGRLAELHIDGLDFVRGIEPPEKTLKGPDNTTSPNAMLELLWTLAKRQDSGDDAGKEMVGLLARAALSQPPAAGMPSDPRNARLVQLAGVGQQSMIVYGPHAFVVVVFIRGAANNDASANIMALIEHALAAGLEASIAAH